MRARLTTAVLAALLAIAVAACGGDAGSDEEPPQIPTAVAERLAALSDETADELEAGDDCAAQETADELERAALESEPQIPAELRGQLREGIQRLTAGISCVPEPVVIETVPEETTTEDQAEELPRCPEDEEKESESKSDDDLPPGLEKKQEEEKGKEDEECKQEDEKDDGGEEGSEDTGNGKEGDG